MTTGPGTGRYFVRLLLPDTETVASEFPCATLADAAQRMVGLADTVEGEGLYDDLGELTVRLVAAGERPLTEQEIYHLEALVQEFGAKTPDADEVEDYRESNPRRRA